MQGQPYFSKDINSGLCEHGDRGGGDDRDGCGNCGRGGEGRWCLEALDGAATEAGKTADLDVRALAVDRRSCCNVLPAVERSDTMLKVNKTRPLY